MHSSMTQTTAIAHEHTQEAATVAAVALAVADGAVNASAIGIVAFQDNLI
jgi:hypothetical protein